MTIKLSYLFKIPSSVKPLGSRVHDSNLLNHDMGNFGSGPGAWGTDGQFFSGMVPRLVPVYRVFGSSPVWRYGPPPPVETLVLLDGLGKECRRKRTRVVEVERLSVGVVAVLLFQDSVVPTPRPFIFSGEKSFHLLESDVWDQRLWFRARYGS